MRALILVALGAGCAGEGTLVVLPAQPTGVHRAGGLAGVAGAGGPSASPDADGFALAIEQPAAGFRAQLVAARAAKEHAGNAEVRRRLNQRAHPQFINMCERFSANGVATGLVAGPYCLVKQQHSLARQRRVAGGGRTAGTAPDNDDVEA